MSNDSNKPVFGLYFRRYAPFKKFGRSLNGSFLGDDRGPSTSILPSVTSRTIGFVVFNRDGVGSMSATSSGTHFEYDVWGEESGVAKVNYTLVRNTVSRPNQFGFRASTAASNPLVPKAPDIDTFVDVVIDFSTPNKLKVMGAAFGDKFPNLEIFLISYRANRTALLLDGRTVFGPNSGPYGQLFGKNENWLLARFHAALALNPKGELLTDTIVGSTNLRDSYLSD